MLVELQEHRFLTLDTRMYGKNVAMILNEVEPYYIHLHTLRGGVREIRPGVQATFRTEFSRLVFFKKLKHFNPLGSKETSPASDLQDFILRIHAVGATPLLRCFSPSVIKRSMAYRVMASSVVLPLSLRIFPRSVAAESPASVVPHFWRPACRSNFGLRECMLQALIFRSA